MWEYAQQQAPYVCAGQRATTSGVRKRREEAPVRPNPNFAPLSDEIVDFFAGRGITASTLQRNNIMRETLYAPPLKGNTTAIAFPYMRDGELVNVKYRTLDKKFWQVCIQAPTLESGKHARKWREG